MPTILYAYWITQVHTCAMDTQDSTSHILRGLSRVLAKLNDITAATAPRLLTVAETAAALGVSKDTVRRMCDRREIRYVQTEAGAAKRIALADIQAWIDRHAVPPAPRYLARALLPHEQIAPLRAIVVDSTLRPAPKSITA